jgi:hypothetical protein
VPADFWGINVRPYASVGPIQQQEITVTPVQYPLWPGGAIADRLNVLADVITNDDGSTYTPPSSEAQFVNWCKQLLCHAIFQLPAETNSPAMAAAEVGYTENTLHYHPEYWEIGNEPALWSHFGIAWNRWSSSQSSGITPQGYAQLVQVFVVAIRSVDPSARIIGLPGLGTGDSGETTWITDTVRLNGPNLSAVGIHVYPAGPGPSNPTLQTFFSGLSGKGSPASRVPQDRAAVQAACPRCPPISVFITEMGSGNQYGTYAKYMSSFPEVPFVATEIVQGLNVNLANIDIFAFQSSYQGSWFTDYAQPTMVYTLYSQVLNHLGSAVLPTKVHAVTSGLFAATSVNPSGKAETVLLVNTNSGTAFNVDFTGSGFPLANGGESWTWDGSTRSPIATPYSSQLPSHWTLPPVSLTMVQAGSVASPLNYTLGGVVTNAATGLPLGGANVTVTGSGVDQSIQTLTSGTFAFSLPNGSYRLTATLTGYHPGSVAVTLAGHSVRNVSIALALRIEAEYSVSGTVVAIPTGIAVAGAAIDASGPGGTVSAVSGSRGNYSFQLPNGTYSVVVTAAGYRPGTASVAINGASLTNVTLNVVAQATSVYPVRGVALDGGTHQPISGAVVTFQGPQYSVEVFTFPNGTFVASLSNGSYAFGISATGYRTLNQMVTVDGAAISGLTFNLDPIHPPPNTPPLGAPPPPRGSTLTSGISGPSAYLGLAAVITAGGMGWMAAAPESPRKGRSKTLASTASGRPTETPGSGPVRPRASAVHPTPPRPPAVINAAIPRPIAVSRATPFRLPRASRPMLPWSSLPLPALRGAVTSGCLGPTGRSWR